MPTIEDGRNAMEQGNLQQARLIFEALLQENARSEEAWLGLAEVLTETNDKRICYENVLKINKNNRVAREALRALEPEADPLVTALKQQASVRIEEDDFSPDSEVTMVSTRAPAAPVVQNERETPTAILIAVGLGLSVVVFAIVSGVLYLIITSLTGS